MKRYGKVRARFFWAVLWLGLAWSLPAGAQPAQRIVTLAPFLAELAYAAGAGDRLVGVSAYSDFPQAVKALPVVADATGVNREALLALHADTVLAWKGGNAARHIEALRNSGVKVEVLDGGRLDDIPKLIRAIGALAGTQKEAGLSAARFALQLAALRSRYASRPDVTALIELWHRPLLTVSGKHFMSDAIAVCGASNVYANEAGVTPEISMESVFRTDPQAIIGAGLPGGEEDFRVAWSRFPALNAVRRGHLIYLDADLLHRQTPRILEGISRLCVALEKVRIS
jgi:iron complex transport system substrate-binding protein